MKNAQNTQNQPLTEIISSNGSNVIADYQAVTRKLIMSLLVNDDDKIILKLKGLKYDYLEEKEYSLRLMIIPNLSEPNFYTLSENLPYYSDGMSVKRFGAKYLYLFNYDLLSNKTTVKIDYNNLLILKK
tara:strand:- start:284 stop:670 length:387 start_codon:yes stop_codon:yes gene_type:complete